MIKTPALSRGQPAAEGDYILERRHRLVMHHAPPRRGRLLDFGCGNGAQTLRFLGDFHQIIGVDLEQSFLADFSREIMMRNMAGCVNLLRYGGEILPLADAVMDAVVSFEVLEHAHDDGAALAQMFRVLKPGGWLALTVPNRWWMFETHGAHLPLLAWNRVPFFSWLPGRIHDRWARARIYRRRQIVELVNRAGFQVLFSAYVTAPLDVLKWRRLRNILRRTLFHSDLTRFPVKATAILVMAEKPKE